MNIDNATLNNGAEIIKNCTKLAANITNNRQPKPQQDHKPDNTNQPHTQTVEVKVGDNGSNQKPTVIREKNETHIHKPFPDNRELSERECEIEKLRLQNEHDIKLKELEFRIRQEEYARADRKEREERARKDAERRNENQKRLTKVFGYGIAACAVLGVGIAAADFYTNTWCPSHNRVGLPAQSGTVPLNEGEGSVK